MRKSVGVVKLLAASAGDRPLAMILFEPGSVVVSCILLKVAASLGRSPSQYASWALRSCSIVSARSLPFQSLGTLTQQRNQAKPSCLANFGVSSHGPGTAWGCQPPES